MIQPIVSIARCRDYSTSSVSQALQQSLEAMPEVNSLLTAGKTVLLKPNLLSASQPPQNAVNTHPQIIKSVAVYCKEKGCRVLIGDSCGSLSEGSTNKALQVTGVPAIAHQTGAEIINFDTFPAAVVAVDNGKILREVSICSSVREADVIITLPKLKTHGLTLMTGAIKNQFGTIPGRGKKDVHLKAPKPSQLAEAVVDIFSVTKPHLAIMDAVVAMEGKNGPAGGVPRKLGLIISSTDAVALDAVAGEIIGYAPRHVVTTYSASQRGLGVANLEEIKISGPPIEDLRLDNFQRPSPGRRRLIWRIVPAAVAKTVFGCMSAKYPRIRQKRCIKCHECIINCPRNALKSNEGNIQCDKKSCIGCYCCLEACPCKAIYFRA